MYSVKDKRRPHIEEEPLVSTHQLNPVHTPASLPVTFSPLYDRVLIKRDEQSDTVSSSGLYIPDTAQKKMQQGTVIAVGDGRQDLLTGHVVSLKTKPGDRVVFGMYAGSEIKLDDEEFLVMHESEVFGVVK